MIGKRIRKLRQEKGWSARELARRSRLAPSIITTAEKNEHSPRLESVQKIAHALGVPIGELFEEVRGAEPRVVRRTKGEKG